MIPLHAETVTHVRDEQSSQQAKAQHSIIPLLHVQDVHQAEVKHLGRQHTFDHELFFFMLKL